jgi:hypothetical protein
LFFQVGAVVLEPGVDLGLLLVAGVGHGKIRNAECGMRNPPRPRKIEIGSRTKDEEDVTWRFAGA